MKTSDTIGKLAAALSKAQAAMTGAKKDSANPFFKSSYADLSAVMAAISNPFADNGLSFAQSPGFEEGRIIVTTRIMHESGEWIEGVTILPPTKNDAQGYGSAITYAKRYGLQAMAGVPSVDDDGNAAVKAKTDPAEELAIAIADHQGTIEAIKAGIADGDLSIAAEAWFELSEDEKRSLWIAPTKGGPFSTVERGIMQTKEFRQAYYGAGEE